MADIEHFIEIDSTGTWQSGDLHRASCECGWVGEWREDRAIAQQEADAHLRQASEE